MSELTPLFKSFLQGGFECSTHRRKDGQRLDVISATWHNVLALRDYRVLADMGILTVRDGVRWHLIEARPNQYDLSSVIPMLRAARMTGTEVIWDLFHYGWPDDIDIFSSEFVRRFESFARAFARVLRNETDGHAFICPMNEPSFLSWAGGEVARINPCVKGRGFELKAQLVRAAIAATKAIREILRDVQIVFCEPAIHIVADPLRPQDGPPAEAYRLLQFQALDMLMGREYVRLRGGPECVDILGVNYYPNNQWIHNGPTLGREHRLHRPFRHMLREIHERYDRPIFISETGTEGEKRPEWLAYIANEVAAARDAGVPVEGICLYPIANHPGWDNDRHCHNGLLDYPDENGNREVYEPLAREIKRQQKRFPHAQQFDMAVSGR